MTIKDAIERKCIVASEFADISRQLEHKEEMRQEKGLGFSEWFHRARQAARHRQSELMRLNAIIKAQRGQIRAFIEGTASISDEWNNDPEVLLLKAFKVLCNLRGDGVEFSEDELAVSNAIDSYFVHGESEIGELPPIKDRIAPNPGLTFKLGTSPVGSRPQR